MHPGKSIEAAVRRLRPYLHPAYRRAYRSLVSRSLSQRKPGEPIVCFDFSDPAIDAVGGRYYTSLVWDFIAAGYFPVFTAQRSTLSGFGNLWIKSLLLKQRLGVIGKAGDIKEPFVLVTDSPNSFPDMASHIIRVDYDYRIANSPDEVPFPIFAHPMIAVNHPLHYHYGMDAQRPARIFFGGNTEEGKYDKKNRLGDIYSMLTRREMLRIACSEIPEEKIYRPQDALEWLGSETCHSFVLCETQHGKIPPGRWLEALSKGDFFLACPGVGMPLCHNLLEAMAAGAVPILQYGNYLTPALENGVNCLTFDSPISLKKVVSEVLSLGQNEVIALRSGVRNYYDRHLAPGRLAARLLSNQARSATLLLNSYRVPR